MPDTDRTAADQRACAEALRRIADCARRRSAALDLSGLGLTRVPAEIGSLAKLTDLKLAHNQLTTVPPELCGLTGLGRLDLSNNMVAVLPPGLAQLTGLTLLDLAHNLLDEVPPELGRLSGLTRLDLSHNPLRSLPPELGRLTALTRLYLSHCRLAALPPGLGGLAGLTRLYLSNNLLESVPPQLGELAQLTRLDLAHNRLASLPPELGQLGKLTVLDISNNQLEELPPELGGLAKLTVLSLMANRLAALPESFSELASLEHLLLHDNPGLKLTPAVLGGDPRTTGPQPANAARPAAAKSILDFYFARLTGQASPLNEARLIVLGRSGTGKTSIVQALRDLPFREREPATAGVALCDWSLDDGHGAPVTVHVWDFSGHEGTHELHPLFLSQRSVYVLVLTGRDRHELEDAHSWLRLIQTAGAEDPRHGPPVIVALNQWNVPGARAELDRAALRELYPCIRGFVEMDCKARKGIPVLKTALCRELERLPWVREPFPEAWNAVRHALTAGGALRTFLSHDAYRALCAEQGVPDQGQQDYLAEALHHLGVALNYQNDPRVGEATVLQPEWLTKNLYALLRRAETLAGVLRQADVEAVLYAEPDAAAQAYLMHLMERFGLARALPDAPDAPGGAWLVPRALPEAVPADRGEFRDAAEAVRLRFTYQEIPEDLVARLIVRRHAFVEELREHKQQWRDGLVLARKGARAWIHSAPPTRQLLLTVIGPRHPRTQLADLCLAEMREIHAQIPGLDPVEEIQVQGEWTAVATPAVQRSAAPL